MAGLFQWLMELLGIWKSEAKLNAKKVVEYEKLKEKQKDKIKCAYDDLKTYKDEIASEEKLILAKEKEMESSHGKTREIVEREIDVCLKKIDLSKGKHDIVFRSIETGNLIVEKLEVLIQALGSPEQDVDLDDLIVELSVLAQDMKEQDRELGVLTTTGYNPASRKTMDVATRLAELHGEIEATQKNDTPQVAEKSSTSLPESLTDSDSAEKVDCL
ncbi:MAG: hypothetical protein PHQ75_09005 [Thermoguttaceae bacterium]|nr:hypothetical protein [Thermoguttaceae bacterium]